MFRVLLLGAVVSAWSFPALAHQDPRNMRHWHAGVEMEITQQDLGNGYTYVTINNSPTDNGSYLINWNEGWAVGCTGDNVTQAEIDDCLEHLRKATGTPPGKTPPVKDPPKEGKPGKGKKKKKKNAYIHFGTARNGKPLIVWVGRGR